ncbi:hypothetical protein V2J09_021371 [Rumex salicifolius]
MLLNSFEAHEEDVLYKKRRDFRFPTLELCDNQIKTTAWSILKRNGMSLEDFPEMPLPDKSLMSDLDNRLIQEEMSYNITMLIEEHHNLHKCLNDEQRVIYDKVATSATDHEGVMYFIYGTWGIGKTFLYRTIMARLWSERHIIDSPVLPHCCYLKGELHTVDLLYRWKLWRIACVELVHRVLPIIWD